MRLIDIPPADQAARIRAAVGYSGKEVRAIAQQLGISYPTLRRRYDRTNPSGASSLEELYAIADACGVPRAFMEEGFDRFEVGGELTDRLRQLEARTRRQTSEARQMRGDLDTLTDGLAVAVQALSGLAVELRAAFRDQLEVSALEAIEQIQTLAVPADPRGVGRGRAG